MVGKNVAKWDPRWMATGAFIMFAVVLWMRSNFTSQTDFGTILLPTLIQGGAMAFFFIPLTTLTLAGLPPERIPAAAGLSNFVRIMFGAMGTSIATTLWDNRATLHHTRLVEQMGLNGTALDAATTTLAPGRRAGRGRLRQHQPADRRAGLHLGRRRHLHRLGDHVPVPDLHDLVHAASAQDRRAGAGGRGRGALSLEGPPHAALFSLRRRRSATRRFAEDGVARVAAIGSTMTA